MNNCHEKALATSENNFGEVIRATGPMAKANPFRFSTKYQDDETDQLYYIFRYYNPSTGRWISRDPLDEVQFRRSYAASLKPREGMAILQRPPSGNEFRFVDNSPLNLYDALGLCPSGTCDKWTIQAILARSIDIGVGFLDLRTKLIADKSCCIEPHERYYKFLGAGIGVAFKLDWTMNYSIGSATFSTPCITWNAHNGFGRVSSAGIGVIGTIGIMYLDMPQGYVRIFSPSWGLDASISTSIGYWKLE